MTEPSSTAIDDFDPTAAVGSPSDNGGVAILKERPSNRPNPASELLRSDAGDIEATTITMDRSGAEQVTAERVVMTKSGARTVEARSAQLDDSGAMTIQAEQVVLQSSSAMAVIAEEARIVNSKVGLVSAGTATFEPGARVFLFAGTTESEVRPVMDVAAATAFGAGLGFVLLIIGRLVRRMTS